MEAFMLVRKGNKICRKETVDYDHDFGDYRVVEIIDWPDVVKFGKGTKWRFASDPKYYWSLRNDNDVSLIRVIISKENPQEKWAALFGKKGYGDYKGFFDRLGREVDVPRDIKKYVPEAD